MPAEFEDLKDGDVLEPFHINRLNREARRWRRAYAVPPLVIDGLMSSDSPPIFRTSSSGAGFLAIANGDIPARSGSTLGVGSVFSVSVAPTYTTGTLTAAAASTDTDTFEVVNPSSSTMTSTNGIDSGQYCWVEQGSDGLYYVSPLECS